MTPGVGQQEQRGTDMLREVAKDATKRFFGQIWDDFVGYMRVYEYLKLKAARISGKTISLPSIESFWYSILGDKFGGTKHPKYTNLRDGDVLKLKNVFISDWAPKLPGKAWTLEGIHDANEAQQNIDGYLKVDSKYFAVLPPELKETVVSAGYGSIRIARRVRDNDHFMYMSLVSEDSWHCDKGIPVVASKQVYELIYRYAMHGAPWLREIEGVLHIDEDLPFECLVPKAIGALLSPESESTLRYRAGLPRCYLHVVSPLSVKPTYNDSHPSATAWAQFKCNRRRQPYRYTYTMFNPSSEDSIENAAAFIKAYVKQYHGTRIITDFDGQRPRLEAELPLTSSPLKSVKNRTKVIRLVKDYNKWIKEKLENTDRYW
jgi:hypothetical protein